MSSEWTATARWIFPADRPPLAGGTITIDGERITAVEPAGRRSADLDYGNAAILPGLVNAHTHLDLTGLRGRCPPGDDFVSWLRRVVSHRRAATTEQIGKDIEAGLAECLRFGTTLVGDIAGGGLSWEILVGAPLRAVVFYELLGLSVERARQNWAEAERWPAWSAATEICRPGLSPHAPYSVRKSLFGKAAAYARSAAKKSQAAKTSEACSVPIAIHLAESRAELDLLAQRGGEFVDFLEDLGVWDPDGLARSPEDVIDCFRDLRHILWVHANYLPPSLIPADSTVVYCPRTHAAFGHSPHPFRELMSRGVRVALGTDSLASSPDLDVLAEARFVHQHYPELPGSELLRMATLNGAEALGFAHETGSLTPGKSADFIVLRLPDDERADPHELVFAKESFVREAVYRGRRTGLF